MLATQTYNFLFIMKLQPQLQFYSKHKETNTEKSDYTLADDELWTNIDISRVSELYPIDH